MKNIIIVLFLLMIFMFWSCSESNPVYNQNYYTNNWVAYNVLNPDGWILADTVNNRWYQTIRMSLNSKINYGNTGVICFYKNRFKAWQAMPAAGIAMDGSGGYYQDELTFSNDSLNLYIEYNNPKFFNPTTDLDTLQIKTVYFDGRYVDSLSLVKQIENNINKN